MSTDVYLVGDTTRLSWTVKDDSGNPVAPATATLTITLPDGTTTTPTLSNPSTGVYKYDYVNLAPGPHSALFKTTGTGTTVAEQDAWDTYAAAQSYVTLAEVKAYLGDTSIADGELNNIIAAEQAAQARKCRIDLYSPDLKEALKRRVARNIAARNIPVAQFTSFEGGSTSTSVPRNDAEINRLEGPYRKLRVG